MSSRTQIAAAGVDVIAASLPAASSGLVADQLAALAESKAAQFAYNAEVQALWTQYDVDAAAARADGASSGTVIVMPEKPEIVRGSHAATQAQLGREIGAILWDSRLSLTTETLDAVGTMIEPLRRAFDAVAAGSMPAKGDVGIALDLDVLRRGAQWLEFLVAGESFAANGSAPWGNGFSVAAKSVGELDRSTVVGLIMAGRSARQLLDEC